mmetsp:Transcript_20797/g.37892  ORF Transcript_20797/g.37892 Transcript_20797/m.37892 type:complete len:240 (-) Transcript_20797:394-1113(-)
MAAAGEEGSGSEASSALLTSDVVLAKHMEGPGTLVTGGLGGLGLIACAQYAMLRMGPVVTTSRSGRLGPHVQQSFLDAFEQHAAHYCVKCDVSNAQELHDLWTYFHKPLRELAAQEYCMDEVVEIIRRRYRTAPSTALESLLLLLVKVKDDYANALAELQSRIKKAGVVPTTMDAMEDVRLDLEEKAAAVAELIADVCNLMCTDVEEACSQVRGMETTINSIRDSMLPPKMVLLPKEDV